jgi:hypothetical protein
LIQIEHAETRRPKDRVFGSMKNEEGSFALAKVMPAATAAWPCKFVGKNEGCRVSLVSESVAVSQGDRIWSVRVTGFVSLVRERMPAK